MSFPAYLSNLGLTAEDVANHSSLKEQVVGFNIVFMLIVIFVTSLRLSARCFMVHAAGLDDVFILLATLFALSLSIFAIVGSRHGLGTHLWMLVPLPTAEHPTLSPATVALLFSKFKKITICLYGCYLSYATAITAVKASIIFSYLRIFPGRRLRIFLYTILLLGAAWWFCSLFAIIFECVPVAKAWNAMLDGKCNINIVYYFYVSSTWNILTDVVLVGTPLPFFWAMNMRQTERIIICCLFGCGFFVCIASIVRISQIHELQNKDVFYRAVLSLNWSVIEVSIAIVCACVPAMRPLAVEICPRLAASHSRNSSALDFATPLPFMAPTEIRIITTVATDHDSEDVLPTPSSVGSAKANAGGQSIPFAKCITGVKPSTSDETSLEIKGSPGPRSSTWKTRDMDLEHGMTIKRSVLPLDESWEALNLIEGRPKRADISNGLREGLGSRRGMLLSEKGLMMQSMPRSMESLKGSQEGPKAPPVMSMQSSEERKAARAAARCDLW